MENENIKNYKISLSGIEQDMKKIDEKDIIGVIDMQVLAEKQGIEEWTAGSYVSEITFNLPEDIIIEERNGDEVRSLGGIYTAPKTVPVENPAFDVTPHELITALITEKGVITGDFAAGIRKQFEE